ncbi:MAG: M23 family metallopeptidase [Gemmatimonadaceae bacterium]
MSPARARALTYAVVAAMGAAALIATPRLPARGAAPAGASSVSGVRERLDTLKYGEPLARLLERGGVPRHSTADIIRAAPLDERRVPGGMPVTFRSPAHPDSSPSEIVLQLAIDRLVRLRRSAAGWSGALEQLPWTTDTVLIAGPIQTTLYDAVKDGAGNLLPMRARVELAWTLADVFEYRVDMSRDLQPGDSFRALVERSSTPSGAVRLGRVLAASFELSGTRLAAVRFTSSRVSGAYFDHTGKSMRAAFLRAPLEFRRISSVFGMRRHPILGIRKKHRGTDYAAKSGTPVRSVGDGVVIRAGRAGGYGRVLEIRHHGGIVTRYAHLRGFARGIRRGTRVAIAQTVGYVGSSGLSTAPHLHFEVLVGGVQQDPRVALTRRGGLPIPSSERAQFEATRTRLLAALDGPPGTEAVAAR